MGSYRKAQWQGEVVGDDLCTMSSNPTTYSKLIVK